ncbi:DUF4215 domain-containing protein [Candidatus Pacearchaeota archaeon]|nr:DUF4215 domain-containing protein [Candidatus Pacearchaeota archaeon]
MKTKTKIENGKTEFVEKTVYIDESGNKVTIKTMKVISEGQELTRSTLKVKGVEINTKLSVTEKINQNGDVSIKARLSTGEEQDITVMPDEALQKAIEELQTTEGFSIELKEIQEGERLNTVFKATAKKTGKILGVFNTAINLETLINTQTGEIVKTAKPWWAFLIIDQDTSEICHNQENKLTNMVVKITEVKAHIEHGDSIGECPETCGDGLKTDAEECDDENTLNGDGCSNFCKIENPCKCKDTICSLNEDIYFQTSEIGETSCECFSEPRDDWTKVMGCFSDPCACANTQCPSGEQIYSKVEVDEVLCECFSEPKPEWVRITSDNCPV